MFNNSWIWFFFFNVLQLSTQAAILNRFSLVCSYIGLAITCNNSLYATFVSTHNYTKVEVCNQADMKKQKQCRFFSENYTLKISF